MPVATLELSDVARRVQEDLESTNGEYLMVHRGKGIKKGQQKLEEFWEAFVTECYESEIVFTSDVVNRFIDWLATLSRY